MTFIFGMARNRDCGLGLSFRGGLEQSTSISFQSTISTSLQVLQYLGLSTRVLTHKYWKFYSIGMQRLYILIVSCRIVRMHMGVAYNNPDGELLRRLCQGKNETFLLTEITGSYHETTHFGRMI